MGGGFPIHPSTTPSTPEFNQLPATVAPKEAGSLQLHVGLGVPSRRAKYPVVAEEPPPGRVTVVLVREPVGV